MYVITGATGNTGSVVAERLLAEGGKVRVVGRDPKRLERFAQKGAESFIADATDAGALTDAFVGAKAVYGMIPPNIASPDVGAYEEVASDALRCAIEKNGIKYAVVLSSVGADKSHGTGPVAGLHSLEKKHERTPGLNALFLRAGYIMENLLPQRKSSFAPPCEGRNPPLPFVLTGVDHSHPYLAERGIDRATAVEFGVGFYARSGLLSGRIVIPIANARGQTLAYAVRSMTARRSTNCPAGFWKAWELFNPASRSGHRQHGRDCGRGLLRLAAGSSSGAAVGGGFDGIVSVSGTGECVARSLPPCDSTARRGCHRPRRQPRHRHPAVSQMPGL